MQVANPYFNKFIKKLKNSSELFYNLETSFNGLYYVIDCRNKFLNSVSKQIANMNKEDQIFALEQLLSDFNEFKLGVYEEKPLPKEKDNIYDYFKRFTTVTAKNRIRVEYDIIEQLNDELFMIESAVIESLPDDENIPSDAIDIDLTRVFCVCINANYNYAQEMVRRKLSRIVGKKEAVKWVLDKYDRIRERINVKIDSDYDFGLSIDYKSIFGLIDEFEKADSHTLMEAKFAQMDADENEAKKAPLNWKVSPVYIVELLVELHRKNYIDFPPRNILGVANAVCGLFKVNPHTIRRYLSENSYNRSKAVSSERDFAYSDLVNMPPLKERKFDRIKQA